MTAPALTNQLPMVGFAESAKVMADLQDLTDYITNLNAGTTSWDILSVAGASSFQGLGTYGVGLISGFTATATTGGTLAGGTYYYKVYAVFGSLVTGQSLEKSVVIGGANNATTLAWTAVSNATAYRVSRGTASGAQSGYYTVTTNSYTDTNASFTAAGNAFSITSASWLTVGGIVLTPASSGGLYFYDYVDQTIVGNISVTSAGEMQYQPGGTGANKGVHMLQDYNQAALIEFDRSSAGVSEMVAWNGGSLGNALMTFGTNFTFAPGNVATQIISGTGMAMGSTKITGLTNGSAATDGAAFGQLKVIQIVTATTTTAKTTTSSTYQDTSLTASITPTSASNKIFMLAIGILDASASNKSALATVFRGGSSGTNVAGAGKQLGQTYAASGGEIAATCTLVYVDAPATNSATTYTVCLASADNVTTVSWGGGSGQQFILLAEVVA